MKMSKADWKAEWVCALPSGKTTNGIYQAFLYFCPIKRGGSLYLSPFWAADIVKYDLETGTLTGIPCPYEPGLEVDKLFFHGVAYGDFIFYTPSTIPAFMRFNTLTNEVDFYSDWLTPLMEQIKEKNEAFYRSIGGDSETDWLAPLKEMNEQRQKVLFLEPAITGSTIWMASCGTNAVVEFNMESCRHRIHEINQNGWGSGCGYGYSGICFDGEHFWLTPYHNTQLVKWNPLTGVTASFDDLFLEDNIVGIPFCAPIYHLGKIWLLPREAKHAVTIDIRTGQSNLIPEYETDCRETDGQPIWKYLWAQLLGDTIYTYNPHRGMLVEYNFVTHTLRRKTIDYPKEALKHKDMIALEALNREEKTYYEGEDYCLADYLNFLSQRRSPGRQEKNPYQGTAGQAIYDYVKRAVTELKAQP
jgi:hypothetical protein